MNEVVPMNTQQDTQSSLELFHEDVLWFDAHRQELLAEYPDQWVGVYRKKVVGASPDVEELMAHLKAKQQPIGRMFFDFVATKPKIWVLASVA